MRIVRFLTLLMIFTSSTTWGDDSISWRYWDSEDGMASGRSKDISIGPDNTVWIMNGSLPYMTVFNGFEMKRIPNPELSSRTIFAGFSNDLWMVCPNGLKRFKDDKWTNYPVEIMPSVNSVLPVGVNKVLMALEDSAVLFNARTGAIHPLDQIPPDCIGSFQDTVRSKDNVAWISGERGLIKLIPERGEITPQSPCEVYNLTNDDFSTLRGLNASLDGEVIAVADWKGLRRRAILGFKDGYFYPLMERRDIISEAWRSGDGTLWYHNNDAMYRVMNGGLPQIQKEAENIYDAELAPDGSFFLGTSENLVHCMFNSWNMPARLKEYVTWVHAIREDRQGRIWFQSKNTLICLNNQGWEFYPLPEAYISHRQETEALCLLPDGRLIFNTENYSEFLIFDPEKRTYESLVHPEGLGMRIMGPKNDGNIWVRLKSKGEEKFQLAVFDGVNFTPYLANNEPFFVDRIRYVKEAGNGDIWIGCLDGLWRLRNGVCTNLIEEGEFPGSAGWHILERPNGEIWVGDQEHIHGYDGTGWKLIKDRLTFVFSMITAKDNSIWVTTANGVHHYRDGSWVQYQEEDGLPSSVIYKVFQDSQQRIWLGTSHGICQYDAGMDIDPPQTLINPKNNLVNIAADGMARFVFSGLDKWKRTAAGQLLFSYRLDGENWSSFAPATVASLEQLSSGRHLFEVRAMDKNFNMDVTPVSFEFNVARSWYQEPGFLVLSVLGTLTILFLIGLVVNRHMMLEIQVRDRTASLRTANEQLQQDAIEISLAEQKLRSLSSELTLTEERERRRLATVLHDRIGHSLALTKMKLGELHSQIGVKQQPQVGKILKQMDSMLDETHSLIFDLSPPILYELGLNRAVEWLAEEFQNEHPVDVQLSLPSSLDPLPEDTRILFYQILRELMINVAKHAKASQVNLSLQRYNGTLEMVVEDNGIGMEPNGKSAATDSGYGLFSIRQRLKNIGGEFLLESKVGKGTRISVQAPIHS